MIEKILNKYKNVFVLKIFFIVENIDFEKIKFDKIQVHIFEKKNWKLSSFNIITSKVWISLWLIHYKYSYLLRFIKNITAIFFIPI